MVMFEWSLEWDCRGQISLPTGMGGKLKTSSSCTVVYQDWYSINFSLQVHETSSPMGNDCSTETTCASNQGHVAPK